MIGRETIAGLLPHGGSMCLIDEVLGWDAQRIHCRSRSHLAATHPLRKGGRLDAVHLIEYAAQSMAIHGGLQARSNGLGITPALLVSVREVRVEVSRLDDLDGPFDIHAVQKLASPRGWNYSFLVKSGGRVLASGRLAIMTNPQWS